MDASLYRNRARRRLREMVMRAANERVKPGHDYVLVARRAALTRPFAALIEDFAGALGRLVYVRMYPKGEAE